MLEKVKGALRLTTGDYDVELTLLIDAALLDLGIAGVDKRDQTDPLVIRAVTTYCKLHFEILDSAEYDRLKASYDEQKAQLGMSENYTTFESEG